MKMRYKNKLIGILILIIVLSLVQYALPAHSKVVTFYNHYIFHPVQSLRNIIFSIIPFSVGDILYLAGLAFLVILVVRWIWYLKSFGERKHELGTSMLRTVFVGGLVYFMFILGWGGNYYKPSLTSYWGLQPQNVKTDSSLAAYDAYLISKLNNYAPGYRSESFQ
ncbi:MAG: DUF3810 family protein, partial [Sphingobacteriales bacterium]